MKTKQIKLYATMTCPYCKMEHAWLKKKNIQHELVFVDLNPFEAQKIVAKTGQMGVPVTEIQFTEGEPQYIIGFDTQRLSQILDVK